LNSKVEGTSIVPIGFGINGTESYGNFGSALSTSADGKTFIVNLYSYTYNTGSQLASIYKFNSFINDYDNVGLYITDNTYNKYIIVRSVTMSADASTIVVGMDVLDTGRTSQYDVVNHTVPGKKYTPFFRLGVVRVYRFNQTSHAYAPFGIEISGRYFPITVSMAADGSTFVVCVPSTSQGQATVYKLNESANAYTQFGSVITGKSDHDLFGFSVSISENGSTFVVGAPYANNTSTRSTGQVRVFKLNKTVNEYTQFGLDINGKNRDDNFGSSVSISADGNVFIVGAPAAASGHVSAYKFNETTNEYSQFGLEIHGKATGDRFGSSVSLSADGSVFVVGAPFHNASSTVVRSGLVRVYQLDPITQKYVKIGPDISGETTYDYLGDTMSLSADGLTLVVGAAQYDLNSDVTATGQVRAYKINAVSVPVPCGLFGLNLFCPRSGKCGLFRRLFNINGC
jgi:hypothetical protein